MRKTYSACEHPSIFFPKSPGKLVTFFPNKFALQGFTVQDRCERTATCIHNEKVVEIF